MIQKRFKWWQSFNRTWARFKQARNNTNLFPGILVFFDSQPIDKEHDRPIFCCNDFTICIVWLFWQFFFYECFELVWWVWENLRLSSASFPSIFNGFEKKFKFWNSRKIWWNRENYQENCLSQNKLQIQSKSQEINPS